MIHAIKIKPQRISEILVFFLLIGLYIYNITKYFWTLPTPSDPLEYLGSAAWGTAYGFWPFLARLALAVNLRIFVLLFSKAYFAGMFYIGFINTAILIVAMLWAFRKSGFWAALFVGIFMNSSYLMLGWATYIYPDQTVALYSLLAFICFFSEFKIYRFINGTFLAGFFTGLAILSKATGFGILLFFVIYLIYKKEWRKIKQFAIGLFIGLTIVVFLFCLLYNYQSFLDAFVEFFYGSLGRNLAKIYTNLGAGYFHEIISSIKYFPFVALFILIGAYKNQKTKNLLFLAWFNIFLVYLLRSSAPSIPTYIYTAYIFTVLGVSIYLADVFVSKQSNRPIVNLSILRKYSFVLFFIIVLILMVVGLRLGIKYHSVENYDYSYNYLKPLDIYETTSFPYPNIIKILYTFIPILLLVCLLGIEILRRKIFIVLFIILTAFGSSFFNGGLAYQKAKYDRERADFFYRTAPILNLVKDKTFSVYVEAWNQQSYSNRLLWVYRLFFDNKYQRVFKDQYKAQKLNADEIESSIIYIDKENDILSKAKNGRILTDRPDIVHKYFPSAIEVQRLTEFNNLRDLVVLDISSQYSIKKTVKFLFQEDFSKWPNETKKFSSSEIEKILPPLKILGLRGNHFKFLRQNSGEDNYVRINLNKINNREKPEINLGYIVSLLEILEKDKNQPLFVTLEVVARTSANQKNQPPFIFIQDKVNEDWDLTKINMPGDRWGEYVATKKLRDGAKDFLAGIGFLPSSVESYLDVKSIKISVWSVADNK